MTFLEVVVVDPLPVVRGNDQLLLPLQTAPDFTASRAVVPVREAHVVPPPTAFALPLYWPSPPLGSIDQGGAWSVEWEQFPSAVAVSSMCLMNHVARYPHPSANTALPYGWRVLKYRRVVRVNVRSSLSVFIACTSYATAAPMTAAHTRSLLHRGSSVSLTLPYLSQPACAGRSIIDLYGPFTSFPVVDGRPYLVKAFGCDSGFLDRFARHICSHSGAREFHRATKSGIAAACWSFCAMYLGSSVSVGVAHSQNAMAQGPQRAKQPK